jgi:hypothetical protein
MLSNEKHSVISYLFIFIITFTSVYFYTKLTIDFMLIVIQSINGQVVKRRRSKSLLNDNKH